MYKKEEVLEMVKNLLTVMKKIASTNISLSNTDKLLVELIHNIAIKMNHDYKFISLTNWKLMKKNHTELYEDIIYLVKHHGYLEHLISQD